MKPVFLDTNIVLRHLLSDDPQQSPKATKYWERIERGEIQACLTDTIIFESVFTLERYYQQPKEKIRQALLPLLELQGVILSGKRRLRQVFDLYVSLNLPFADAYHAVLSQHLKTSGVVSFDKHFDRIPGIKRIVP